MENYRGDLTDIIRATGGGGGAAASAVSMSNICDQEMLSDDTVDWELSANPMNNYPPPPCGIKENTDEFGDPFSNRRDPLLLLLQQDPAAAADTTIPSCSGGGGGSSSIIFRNSPSSSGVVVSEEAIKETTTTTDSFVDQGRNGYDHLRHHSKMIIENEDEEGGQQQQQRNYTDRPAANIFSRMLQISPQNHSSRPSLMMTPDITSPRGGSPGIIPNDHRHHQIHHHHVHSNDNNNNHLLLINNTSKTTTSSLIENNGGGGGAVQISSPRNAGIKRRKSQAKKVVCIPAPTPANSRPSSGEVVPSDLWAWRKYGQKPIKGSPYPRGYYRCSSSKGCSARKQVERSRTDPNMLVITYTSEHNHPWPTQRNALAGSTRAQPAATKGGGNHVNCSSNSSSSNKIIKAAAATSNCFLKQNEDGIQTAAAANVKEEMVDEEHEKEEEEDHSNYYREGGGISVDDQVMSELGFPLESYRPDMLAAADTNNFPQLLHHQEDLFGGLGGGGGGEMETDPLNLLLFTQGFSGMVNQEEEVRESTNAVKTNSDPFAGLFDWAASTSGADDDQPKS